MSQSSSSHSLHEEEEQEEYKPPPTIDLSNGRLKQKEEEHQKLIEGEEVIESYADMNRLEVPEFEKNKGKEAFQKQNYQIAVKHYSKALLAFQFLVKDGQIRTQEQMVKFIEDIEIPCNSNLAICNLKLKEYKQCIHFATKVIEKDENNIKALYRRGMAHLYINEFDEARSDFKDAYALDPTSKEIQLAFEQLQIRKTKIAEKQKQFSKKMLENLDYSDKVEEARLKKEQDDKAKEEKDEGIVKKVSKSVMPDFKQILYNVRVTALVCLNFFSEKCCKRRIPAQYFNKDK